MFGLKDFLKNTVLKPGLQRLGTVVAVWLIASGEQACQVLDACGLVTEAGAARVVNYAVAVVLLAFDLLYIHVERWLNAKKGGR